MKKLITTVVGAFAAIASAFAVTPAHRSGADFSADNYEVGTNFVAGLDDQYNDPSTESYWWNGSRDDFEGTIAEVTGEGEGESFKYLDFESSITNPLYRTINNSQRTEGNYTTPDSFVNEAIGTGLFIDTTVKFTPYEVSSEEDGPTPTGVDKLIVWLREMEKVVPGEEEEENQVVLETNLIVTAGYYADGEVTKKNYVMTLPGDMKPEDLVNGFRRLTIKSFANVTSLTQNYVGFVVYLDGNALEYEGDAGVADSAIIAKLTETASKYYTSGSHKLLPSLYFVSDDEDDIMQKISAVGFAGTGAIKEVYFDNYTTSYPEFAGDNISFRVEKEEGVLSYQYDSVIYETNATFSVAPTITEFQISDVVYDEANGYYGKAGTWYDGRKNVIDNAENSGTFSLTNGTDRFVIAAYKSNYYVGEVPYKTLEGDNGAFAAALAAGLNPGGVTLKLNCDNQIDSLTIDEELLGQLKLTIDLAGHTLCGTNEQNSTISVLKEEANVEIIDTSLEQTGKVLAGGSGYAVSALAGLTTIDAGQYETIEVEDDTLLLTGGKFLDEFYDPLEPQPFYLTEYVDEGLAVNEPTEIEGLWYYTIGEAPADDSVKLTFTTNGTINYTVTTNNGVAVTLANNVASVETNVAYVITVTPATGYKFAETPAGWTAGDDCITSNGTAAANATIVLPTATEAIPWEGEGMEDDPYQIATYDDLVALQAWVAAGKTTAGVYFQQMDNIDMSATATDGWVGIGTLESKTDIAATFKGVYDGDNKEITNLTFSGDDYNGLFASAYGATIKNLKVAVAGIKGGGAAAFVGCAVNCQLSNLTSTGSIGAEGAVASHSCAGIAVRFEGSTAYACTNKCEIWTSKNKIGGIAAIGQSASMDYFILCSNEGELHCTNANLGDGGCGGIFGYQGYTDYQPATYQDCRSIAALHCSDKTRTGSLLGSHSNAVGTYTGTNIVRDDVKVCGSHNEGPAYGKVLGGGLVELCAASAFVAGETYQPMYGGLTPAYTFTDAGTIAFNTNLFEAAAFNVTGDPAEKFDITSTEAAGVVTFTAAVKTYTITFDANGGSGEQASINYTWLEEKLAPECTFTAPENGTFNCWSNATDHSVFKVGAPLDTDLGNYTLVADWTIAAGPDVPVDDPTALDEKGKENAAEVAAEIAKGGTDVNTWVAKVYGEGGKIPASKLNATTPANIALAVANDLPITVAEPKFEVSASTVTAESGNVAAFEFTLKDGTTSVELKAITDKVKAMVRYTSALGTTTPFHEATTDEVAVNADPVNGKIKAELKQTAANAGFMKVEPQQPTVGGL